jgi:chemotaxis signal transduction protein
VTGYVSFVLGGRVMAGRLEEVREVVRAVGVEPLTGSRAPVTGLLVLRGTPLPVVDLRSAADPGDAGDVLVLQGPDGAFGLAVDRVLAVLEPGELAPIGGLRRGGLPSYVVDVCRDAGGAPVFVVSLPSLAGLVPA